MPAQSDEVNLRPRNPLRLWLCPWSAPADGVLTRHKFTGLIIASIRRNVAASGPETEAAFLSMSRLETAMNRLDAAMARLDAAVGDSAHKSGRGREAVEQELEALRQTHEMLQDEARLVSDRLDEVVGRLQNVMAGSL